MKRSGSIPTIRSGERIERTKRSKRFERIILEGKCPYKGTSSGVSSAQALSARSSFRM